MVTSGSQFHYVFCHQYLNHYKKELYTIGDKIMSYDNQMKNAFLFCKEYAP